jgi:hypothetical protein
MKNSRLSGMCLNWKVLAGLGAIGLGIWLFAPGLVGGGSLLLLLALACPLSCVLMLLPMMRGNQGSQGMACCAPGAPGDTEMNQEYMPSVVAPTSEEQLVELRFQLANLQTQHEAMKRELAALEAEEESLQASPSAVPDDERQLSSSW